MIKDLALVQMFKMNYVQIVNHLMMRTSAGQELTNLAIVYLSMNMVKIH